MGFLASIVGNPLYMAIAAGVIFGAGAVTGGTAAWTANGWRLGKVVAVEQGNNKALTLTNDTLTAANKRCEINVQDVRAAVKGVVDESAKLTARAAAAMTKAEGRAKSHMSKADEILNRPPVAQPDWCSVILQEQSAYVAERRGLRMELNLKTIP